MKGLIYFFINAWADCKDNITLKIVFISSCIMIILFTIIFTMYFWWIVLIIVALAIWAYIQNRNFQAIKKQEKQQLINELSISLPYIMRKALNGLEPYLGLPNIDSKGYCTSNIKSTQNGIIFIELKYLRLHNLAELDKQHLEQLRNILNSNIETVMRKLIFDLPIPETLYVSQILSNDGEIAIYGVPVIDVNSRTAVNEHKSKTIKYKSIGNTTVITKNSNRELKDDEL